MSQYSEFISSAITKKESTGMHKGPSSLVTKVRLRERPPKAPTNVFWD